MKAFTALLGLGMTVIQTPKHAPVAAFPGQDPNVVVTIQESMTNQGHVLPDAPLIPGT